jgi:hypothetical protein
MALPTYRLIDVRNSAAGGVHVSAQSAGGYVAAMTVAPVKQSADRTRLTARLLDLAELALAQWLFGNVYEAVVKVPERLATPPSDAAGVGADRTSILGPGSPVRYYVPAAPVTAATLFGALIASRRTGTVTRWLTASAGCWIAGAALTAYLVVKVNLRLFFGAEAPPADERDTLLRRWHRVNVLRTAAVGGALVAAHRARLATERAR